jgi:type I restriction enzyme S subunit
MKPEQLLQHFDRISEAPDAIPRLRRFILDLAVRGKLVEQDPDDEPAVELLKRIKVEKAELSDSGRRSNIGKISILIDSEMPYSIPENWVWVSFGDIMISRDGERIPVSKEDRNTRSKIYDYYGASGVIDKIDAYLFDKPLLLIGEDGANLINRSTPIAFIARGKYWVNNHAHVLDGISEEFLQFIELHINAIDLKPFVTGTAQPKMNQAKMNSIPIALPPLAEQRRIVTKVDELMALCDQLQAAQTEREQSRDQLVAASLHSLNPPADDEAANTPEAQREHARFIFNHLPRLTTRPAHIKQLRQTILNLAVRGKLVPQDPNDEPAVELLKRIQDEKTRLFEDGEIKKQELLPDVDDEEAPFKLPKNWAWSCLGNVLIKLTDGTHHSPPNLQEGDFKYVTAKNIKAEGVSLSGITYVSGEIHREIYARCNPVKGDILYIKDGATTGVVTINDLDEPFSMLSSVALLKLPSCLYNRLIVEFLRSPFFYDQMRGFMKGAAITRVTLKRMSPALIPLPPLTEQHRIVAKVDELMALCDQLETLLTSTAADSRHLLEAVLHEALLPATEKAA